MPVLMLQPLLENAISPRRRAQSRGWVIGVRLWEDGDTLHIAVTNSIARTRSKGSAARSGDNTLGQPAGAPRQPLRQAASLEATEDRDRFTALVRIPTRGGNP